MRTSPTAGTRGATSYTALTYLALFGLSIAIPLLLVLGALLLRSATTQRQELENRVSQVLEAQVNAIDRELERDVTILNTLATSQALEAEDWRAFYDQAKAGLQGRAYLVLIDAEGRQLVNTYVPYGEQPAVTGDPESLRRMAQIKAPIVSNLFVSLVVKKPVFNVSIPILEDGRLRYMMSLGLLPEDLTALLASQRLGPEWATTIWDAHGVILARSKDNARYVGRTLPPRLRERAGPAVVRTTNLEGADVLHAVGRSQASGWGVGVNVPYSLITQQMRNALLAWAVAAGLAVALAVALAFRFARPITTSLSVASKAAGAFGRGGSVEIGGSRLREVDTFLVALKDAQGELARARDHQQLLVRELQHRTQNLLAVTQAIVSRSLSNGQSAADAKEVITGRLQALGRAHAILAGSAWEGASLHEILKREFGDAFADAVTVTGCDIVVNAGAAHQFALIVHELTTNAVKYGALSAPGGRISVAGAIEQADTAPRFSLTWTETGGPPVAEPTRKGFGSRLLIDAARQFGMDVTVSYDPQGLRYVLRAPLGTIASSIGSDSMAPVAIPPPEQRPAEGELQPAL